ncbi:YceG family protein [Hallella bergensis DSM 17361]|uniref:Endolytic murein transglycosylase n=1 Tax=Hallella bergensis DSM 17361 TaxID=585502 RepID=D1PYD8_9BACT|nr:endolytic transglycosylase MltG [Hallella bergensis]EFA43603.1 YceG family protein [Hallella bergensis DSM 17361]
MKKNVNARYLVPALICLLLLAALGYYCLFASFSGGKETTYIYIDRDDNYDSLMAKLKPIAVKHCYHAFSTLSRHSSLVDKVHAGRYEIGSSTGTFTLFRRIKNGMQTSMNLTIPSVRTMEDLAGRLGDKLMLDSLEMVKAFKDEAMCKKYGYDTLTIPSLFIPNTYDVYWTVSLDRFMDYMQKENKKFWNEDRTAKAEMLKLSPVEVTTLASIVDEETANNEEKPMVAGMYYNRLMLRNAEYPKGMPLQADPTIKFAWKQFGLKRIYNKLLYINSPYNTYRYPGLPPGPIRIPSVAGIDAVLNMVHHDYIYMCAKEDFSGTHNFARTYQEHLGNAHRYAVALNQRGIK